MGNKLKENPAYAILELSEPTVERIILALQVMATDRNLNEPQYEMDAYAAALREVGEALRP